MSTKTRITREPCKIHPPRTHCWVVHLRIEHNPHEWEMHCADLHRAVRAADAFRTLVS